MLWPLRVSENKLLAQSAHHSSLRYYCAMQQQLNFKFRFRLRHSSYRHRQLFIEMQLNLIHVLQWVKRWREDHDDDPCSYRSLWLGGHRLSNDRKNGTPTARSPGDNSADASWRFWTEKVLHQVCSTHTHTQSHILERGAQICNW